MDVPYPTVKKSQFTLSWCTLKTAIKIAFKYLIHGAIIALAVKFTPVYGTLIDDKEAATIAVVSAVTMFVLNKFLPDDFIALNI